MKTQQDILQQLTIDEKCELTYGKSNWTFFGNERLGLPQIMCGDGPHGLRAYKKDPEHDVFDRHSLAPTTLFPVASAMASTFQPKLLHQIGKAIGEECNMYNVDLLLAPGINMKRSPLGGRNFEYYSEDPYLTGVCASSFVNGVQSTKVGATIKHFAFNEQENQRRFLDTIVDERTMHEFYLRPFHYAITHSNPLAIMSSYNRIHGHYGSESSYLLKEVLRDMWQYKGMVISDWGAVQDKVKSIQTGMNIEMPGPTEFRAELTEAVHNNQLTEEQLDESLRPLIDFYNNIKDNPNKGKKADLDAHHTIASSVAEEAIVLLENDGILPVPTTTKLAVVGSFAKHPRTNGGGSATLLPYICEIPLEELKNTFSLEFASGYEEEHTNEELLEEVKQVIDKGDVIVFFTGTTEQLETEGKDREHMNIPDGHLQVFEVLKTAQKPIIVILNNGSALDVTPFIGTTNAIVEAWLLGGANGKALVNVLTGKTNPSGRLAETFPIKIEHTPHYGEFPSKLDSVNYAGDIIRNGYRYYDTHDYPVRYPFGYGLSYTTFEYSNLELDKIVLTDGETLTVKVTVRNTGQRAGKEVVQLYVRDVDSYYPRPYKELRAFEKISLQPQESQVVTFTLDDSAFSVYCTDFKDFRVESGQFEILVGKNVNTICLKQEIDYQTTRLLRQNLTLEHPLKNFKLYKKQAILELESVVGEFAWYNIEEPAIRVLKRLARRHSWPDETFETWKELLLK